MARITKMPQEASIRTYGLVPDSIVDGPGLRFSVFVQGCTHACPGCHNPESQPSEGGTIRTVQSIYDEIKANKLVHAVTFSGGEPFEQASVCAQLAAMLKADGYDVWAYSGYLFEDLYQREDARAFMGSIDVLVDGPFVESLRSLELDWRGSSNQRLIDVPKSLQQGRVVEWVKPTFEFEKPPSW